MRPYLTIEDPTLDNLADDEGELPEMMSDPRPVGSPEILEQIKGHLSAFRSLVKVHNSRGNVSPIHLSFDHREDQTRVRTVVTRKEIVDADLKRPFKEAVKTPLTWRIIEFTGPNFKMSSNIKLYDGTTNPKDHLSRFLSVTNLGEWPMPVWCRIFQQTLDGSARGWFKNLSVGSIDRWVELRQQFALGVLKVMKISLFMDAHKCPELAKWYCDKVPKTVDERMTRLDDSVRSDEEVANIESPKGEASEAFKKSTGPISRREDRFHRGGYGVDRAKGGELDEGTHCVPSLVNKRCLRRATHHRGHHGRVRAAQSVRRSGSVGGGDVLAFLREPKPRYEVTPKEHSDGFGRVCMWRGEIIRKNQKDGFKNPLSSFFNKTLHGRDRVGHSSGGGTTGESGSDKTNTGQCNLSGPAGLKNGKDLLANRDKNIFNVAKFPLRLCISFKVRGDCISTIALVFFGLARIPSEVTMYPRNFPSSTSNEYFLGFNFMLILHRLSNVSMIFAIRTFSSLLLMTISSMYATSFLDAWALLSICLSGWSVMTLMGTALTVPVAVSKYTYNISSFIGVVSDGSSTITFFISWNAFSAFSVDR
nr:reverse transcriptase domain-containing protein [Tanacetum cinerariifolium]